MSCDQALAVWQWWRYCGDQLPAGKAFLRINLDETSVCLFQGGGKGTVFVKKSGGKKPEQKVSRGKRRCCLTHVGLICDKSDLQPVLPQVIIGSEATFLVRDFDALKASCPASAHLLRQKSAWNNITTFINIINLLAAALERHIGELQPILFLDACKIHLSSRVVAACVCVCVCVCLCVWVCTSLLLVPRKGSGRPLAEKTGKSAFMHNPVLALHGASRNSS